MNYSEFLTSLTDDALTTVWVDAQEIHDQAWEKFFEAPSFSENEKFFLKEAGKWAQRIQMIEAEVENRS